MLGGWGGQCPGTGQRSSLVGHGQGDPGGSGRRPAHKRALGAWGEDSGEAWSWEMRSPACPLVPPCKGAALGSGLGS